jgi:glycosyltransferase involved in cell wall biosynthesis
MSEGAPAGGAPIAGGPEVPISVIVPVLNEEPSLAELHARLERALPASAEIIFVDDGSTDGTPEVLGRIARGDPRVRVLRFRRRFGKSAALAAGFRRARGSLIATTDADLQEDPADIARLADRLGEGFDVVVGWRKERRDRPAKVLGSRLFNFLVSAVAGNRFRDLNCGLKVLRREVLDDLALVGGFHRFIPLLAHWKGFRVKEVEVRHEARRHGASRYGGERILRALFDLAVVLFFVRLDGRPARWIAALGALLGLTGAGIASYLAWLRLATGSIQSKFPLLALGLVLIVVGVQLASLGLLGELLAYHFRSRFPFEPAAREVHAAPPGDEAVSPGRARGDNTVSPGRTRGENTVPREEEESGRRA